MPNPMPSPEIDFHNSDFDTYYFFYPYASIATQRLPLQDGLNHGILKRKYM